MKKMAVLFTDIVGSSKFFKSHGNLAGREMLRQHQVMTSPLIIEHGGSVVKFLGDSVMAYFLSPKDAIRAAVKIQQAFQRYNYKKEQEKQIHIRLCIHYGDGIIEEKDIFGNVVNIAAKLLALTDGDQIYISQEVYDQVKDLFPDHFELANISDKKNILKGLTIFRVIWDETTSFDPITKTIL
ncbi:MAG: adenylate/guanylate cyclase domain-containing protein, partial [Thermodesulfobacteriota bacterium]|nr:adenylate/guanylate cyclase domain-containing protein [Thermodesulfobacteriota bacterium]